MSVGAVNKQTGERIPTAGMPAIDDALDLTSVNPVQNTVITAALASKQDKTDNNLQTTDKTIVGAINEHEGDINSLMSGLTNVNSNLSSKVGRINTDVEAPIRTNLFDKDNKDIVYKYYDGTSWHDVSAGTWQTIFVPVIGGLTYTASGFPAQGGVKTVFTTGDKTTVLADFSAADNNQTFTAPSNAEYIGFGIYSPNANYDSAKFEIGSTASAYTAYTPSVNERLEAVENLIVKRQQTVTITSITANSSVTTPFQPETVSGYSWAGFTPLVNTDGVMITIGWINNAFRIIARNFNNSDVTDVEVEINWIFVKLA